MTGQNVAFHALVGTWVSRDASVIAALEGCLEFFALGQKVFVFLNERASEVADSVLTVIGGDTRGKCEQGDDCGELHCGNWALKDEMD